MSEHEDARERAIIERSKQLFDESVRRLDGETRSKLAQARAKAVDAAESTSDPVWPIRAWLVPAGAVVAGVLAFLIWQPPRFAVEFGPVEIDRTPMISDLDILLEEESLELFEQLEFYAWLLEQPELADTGEAEDGSG